MKPSSLREKKNEMQKQKNMNNVRIVNESSPDEGSLNTLKNKSACEATNITGIYFKKLSPCHSNV